MDQVIEVVETEEIVELSLEQLALVGGGGCVSVLQ
jgi:hypothetical protein